VETQVLRKKRLGRERAVEITLAQNFSRVNGTPQKKQKRYDETEQAV
jgi:hypothetical protein